MPTKFLEGLGGKLAEQWAASLLTPAFVFWLGGLIAWIQKFGWNQLQQWLTSLGEPLQIAVLVGSLLPVAASAFVVQRFDLAVLRCFEGYWPEWMAPLKDRLVKRQRAKWERLDDKWQLLKKLENELLKPDPNQEKQLTKSNQLEHLTPTTLGNLLKALEKKEELPKFTSDQKRQLVKELDQSVAIIDWQLRQMPAQPERLTPTTLGNLLRAAENQPTAKYGLDAIICWSRLWLVLPETVKKELQEARADLNTAARVWLWGLLFVFWTIWAWWAVPIALLVALFAHRWMLDAAATYGDLLESAFDLHRMKLYQSLHFPLPTNSAEERELGAKVTQYLWRGTRQDVFVYPMEKAGD
ncbi:MAG: hypothetical protein ACKO7W_22755 [Elainella sp.]